MNGQRYNDRVDFKGSGKGSEVHDFRCEELQECCTVQEGGHLTGCGHGMLTDPVSTGTYAIDAKGRPKANVLDGYVWRDHAH